MTDRIGSMVGQYRIVEKLGEGGMGVVYKAIDTMIERPVAIKMLNPEIARQPNLLDRFRTEAVTVAKLNHSGIATLYSFMQQDQDFFMVMEYVPGKTLEAIEKERGALPWQVAVPLACKILEAIQPAHEMGIVHRDIKPANIMLTTWGTIKVMDFGISRMLAAPRMTTEGRLIGTIEYISPERVEGKPIDIRADIYSLAVVLFEMLCNRLPFQSDSEFELMRSHLQNPMPSFQEVGCDAPLAIEEVLRVAMAKSPEDRYGSCDAFAAALSAASGNITVTKRAVVDLVGPLAVQDLGTSGHAFTSGEMPNMAAPQTASRPAATPTVSGPASVPAQAGLTEWLRANWKIAAAIAFVFLSIAIGVTAGLVNRHSQSTAVSSPAAQPAMQLQQAPVAAGNPGAPAPIEQPPADTSPSPPPQAAKPAEPPRNNETRHPPTPKMSRRERAWSALDQ
jgi:serine/threonine-protein kinase